MKLKSVICLGVFACLSLAGCNTKAPKEHVHSYDKDNIEWQWTEQASGGYRAKAILSCTSCEESADGHFLKIDAEVTEKQTKDPTCIAPGTITYTATINYEGQEYSAKKEKPISNPNAHHYVEVQEAAYLKSVATCTEDAVYFKSCEHCHEKSDDTFTVINSKLGHNLEHHAATTSTCQVHGNIEYYECGRCHKLFSDENATTELSASDIELPYAHNMTYHAGTPATCDTDGTHDYYTCSYESETIKYKDQAGTEKFNDDSELVIPRLGHTYNESLECVRGDATLKQEYGMADATALDTIDPVTISDLGITSGKTLTTGSEHTYGHYDYPAKHGIDLWFEFSFTPISTDSWMYFYLFNQGDEAGIVCRIQTNRMEDDGIIPCYIYSHLDYSANPGTTVVHQAGKPGTYFYFPRITGVKSTTTNVMHATAYCLDETTNLYRCAFTMGVKNGVQHYPSTNAEDLNNVEQTFDICLGEHYFDNSLNRRIRFSAATVTDFKIYDASSEEKSLVYKDAFGNAVGKLNNLGTASIPELVSDGKTFLGWFDPKGNRITDGDTVSGKMAITPRFVANKTNMFVPSDTSGGNYDDAKGGWHDVTSTSATGASSGEIPVSEISGGYDIYFIYRFVSKSSNDNYAIFDVPFDYLDAKTRIELRIDNKENGSLDGYLYGSNNSLGGAGASGTHFTSSGFRANGSDLLIHIAISNASAAGLTYEAEIINLGNGQLHTETRNVTFDDTTVYSLNDPLRNKFDCVKVNCEYRITDAF